MPQQSTLHPSRKQGPTLTRNVLVRVTPEFYVELTRAADEMGAPLASWLRRAMRRQLAAEGHNNQEQQA